MMRRTIAVGACWGTPTPTAVVVWSSSSRLEEGHAAAVGCARPPHAAQCLQKHHANRGVVLRGEVGRVGGVSEGSEGDQRALNVRPAGAY